jgi:hypothetical protein
MPTVYTEVEVDVELDDFETDDLIEELERRGEFAGGDSKELVEEMYEAYKLGKHDQVDTMLKTLFYEVAGRIA